MGIFNKIFGKNTSDIADRVSCQHDKCVTPKTECKNGKSINVIGKHYQLAQLKPIPMGTLSLRPIDAGFIFENNMLDRCLILNEISPNISKFMPGFVLQNKEKAQQFFMNKCFLTENGQSFIYGIYNNECICCGFIFINTPSFNLASINFNHWTIDFCVFSILEGKGVMSNVIARMLYFLKSELMVDNVYAIVDDNNIRCLSLLSKLPFDRQTEILTDPNTGNVAQLFCCPIHSINFQKR